MTASALDAQEAAFFDAQVELAVAPFKATLSASDLAWMRARLLDALREDPHLSTLARAACPRNVEESTEVVRGAATSLAGSPSAEGDRGNGRGGMGSGAR